ncbi:MAG: hypothetical protein ACREOD_06435 [Candidatus Dormibacteria bacterium]
MGDDNVRSIELYLMDPEAAREQGQKDRQQVLQSTLSRPSRS